MSFFVTSYICKFPQVPIDFLFADFNKRLVIEKLCYKCYTALGPRRHGNRIPENALLVTVLRVVSPSFTVK